jgi:hypothetical protein
MAKYWTMKGSKPSRNRKGSFYIYIVTCIPNGKKYVGVTSRTVARRWRLHTLLASEGSGFYFHKAIRKYGVKHFRVRLLDTARTWAAACKMERDSIAKFKTFGADGYNLTLGGDGAFGLVKSVKSRAQQGASMKKVWESPAFRSGMRDIQKLLMTKKRRAHHSAVMKKVWARPSARAQLSARASKQWADPKVVKLMVKRWANPLAREMQRKRMMERWANPVIKARLSKAMRGAKRRKHATLGIAA